MSAACFWTAEGRSGSFTLWTRLGFSLRAPRGRSCNSLTLIAIMLACPTGILLAWLHAYGQGQMACSATAAAKRIDYFLTYRSNIIMFDWDQ